jgi:hypothetical protein
VTAARPTWAELHIVIDALHCDMITAAVAGEIDAQDALAIGIVIGRADSDLRAHPCAGDPALSALTALTIAEPRHGARLELDRRLSRWPEFLAMGRAAAEAGRQRLAAPSTSVLASA